MAVSSSGLGRGPLTAETRVRVPVPLLQKGDFQSPFFVTTIKKTNNETAAHLQNHRRGLWGSRNLVRISLKHSMIRSYEACRQVKKNNSFFKKALIFKKNILIFF